MTGAEVIIPAILGTTGAAAGTTALTAAELAAALSTTGGVAAGAGGALGTAALTGAELGAALSTTGGVAAGTGGALGSTALTGAELGGALTTGAATAVPEAGFGAKALTTAKALAKEAVVPLAGAAATSALTPKVDIPKPVGPPTINDAKLAQEAADRQRRRRGGAANILTGKLGDPSRNQTAAKTLLGS